MRISVIYLKSILAGVAAFVVTVMISSAAAISFMAHYPQLAQRIFPPQHFEIQFGASYYVNFPLRQILILGLLALAITFRWMVRTASGRPAG
jgi:hypothetical protein